METSLPEEKYHPPPYRPSAFILPEDGERKARTSLFLFPLPSPAPAFAELFFHVVRL